MKKIIALLLSILMLLSLCACGNSETADKPKADANDSSVQAEPEKEPVDHSANLKQYFDETKYTSKKDDPFKFSDDSYSVTTTYKLKEKTPITLSDDIVIESTEITLGVTKVSDLIADGWKINGILEQTVPVNTSLYGNTATHANGKKIDFYALNNTDATIKRVDCVVEKVSLSYSNYNNGADFIYGDEIKNSSTPADIISKFDNPTSITLTEYYNGNEEFQYNSIVLNYTQANDRYLLFSFDNENETVKMNSIRFDFDF